MALKTILEEEQIPTRIEGTKLIWISNKLKHLNRRTIKIPRNYITEEFSKIYNSINVKELGPQNLYKILKQIREKRYKNY